LLVAFHISMATSYRSRAGVQDTIEDAARLIEQHQEPGVVRSEIRFRGSLPTPLATVAMWSPTT
jgi:hypothetical protein